MKVFSNGGILTKAEIASQNESFKVAMPATMSHLTPLYDDNIRQWKDLSSLYGISKSSDQSLDLLYQLTNGKKTHS